MVDTLGVGFLPVACGGWAAGVVMPSGSMVRGWCLALALALAARRILFLLGVNVEPERLASG